MSFISSINTISPSSFFTQFAQRTVEQQRIHPESRSLTEGEIRYLGQEAINSPRVFDRLWSCIESSRGSLDQKVWLAARNAITALNSAGFPFSGKNLSEINIPGADLSNGIFHRADFTRANLQNVLFRSAFLSEVVFKETDLRGANFGQFQLTSVPFERSFRGYYSLATQGDKIAASENRLSIHEKIRKIHIWSLESQKIISTCVFNHNMISLVFSPDSKFLIAVTGDARPSSHYPKETASLSEDPCGSFGSHITNGCIHIWDVETGHCLHSVVPSHLSKNRINKICSPQNLEHLMSSGCLTISADFPDCFEISSEKERVFHKDSPEGRFRSSVWEHMSMSGCSVSSDPTTPLIACTNFDGDIYLWNFKEGSFVNFINHSAYIQNDEMTFSQRINHSAFAGTPLFTQDGKSLVISTHNGIKLIDISTKQVIKNWSSPCPIFHRVIYSVERSLLATIGLNGISIWSFYHEEPIKILDYDKFKTFNAESIAFSTDGSKLAVGTKEIHIWNTEDWTLFDHLKWPAAEQQSYIIQLRFTMDNQRLVAIREHQKLRENIRIWTLSNKSFFAKKIQSAYVDKVRLFSNNTFFFYLIENRLMEMNILTGHHSWQSPPEVKVDDFAISLESCGYFLIRSNDQVVLWERQNGIRVQRKIFEPEMDIFGIGFLPGDRSVIIRKDKIEIYDISADISSFALEGRILSPSVYAFSSDGQFIATGSKEGRVVVWDSQLDVVYTCSPIDHLIQLGLTAADLSGFDASIISLSFSGKDITIKTEIGLLLWIPEDDIYIWNKVKGKGFETVYRFPSNHPSHFVGYKEGRLEVHTYSSYEAEGQKCCSINLIKKIFIDQRTHLSSFLGRLGTPPLPPMITLRDDFGRFQQWSTDFNHLYTTNYDQAPSFSTIAVHPTELFFVTGGHNGMIHIWEPTSGRLLRVLWGHTNTITHLAFSEDGNGLLSIGSDQTLMWWDLTKGIDNSLLKWKSGPSSLIINGINIFNAKLNLLEESLFIEAGVKTDSLVLNDQLRQQLKYYVLRPHVFPPAPISDHSIVSNMEVKDHDLILATHMFFCGILKASHPIKSFLFNFAELMQLTPPSFHFILNAMQSSAKAIDTQSAIDPVSECILDVILRTYEMFVPPIAEWKDLTYPNNHPFPFTREALEKALIKMIRLLLAQRQSREAHVKSESYQKAGDIFRFEKNDYLALACYNMSLKERPQNELVRQRQALTLLKINRTRSLFKAKSDELNDRLV